MQFCRLALLDWRLQVEDRAPVFLAGLGCRILAGHTGCCNGLPFAVDKIVIWRNEAQPSSTWKIPTGLGVGPM